MSFDLAVWKALEVPSADEARETYEALLDGDPPRVIENPDVGAFVADLADRFPWLNHPEEEPGHDGFELVSLPGLRPTGASFGRQLASIRAELA
jgi:hypothetical protein